VNYYVTTILVYLGIDILAIWGLNVQYGLCGVYNFGFILFQASGAYTAAILTLGPSSGNGSYQSYFFGASLPFPVAILVAGGVAAIIGVIFGLLTSRVGEDYLAVLTFVLAVVAILVVSAVISFLDGPAGLSSVPQPLASVLNVSTTVYSWIYVAFVAVVCLLAFLSLRLLALSPLGRAMRAVRESEKAAASVGKNVAGLRIFALAYGGALAGISGALLVMFITTWSPGSWEYAETLTAFSAIIIGGTGNLYGAALGAFVVQIVIFELPRFLPQLSAANLVGSMQWIVIGILTLGFMWWRPQGLLPERKRSYEILWPVGPRSARPIGTAPSGGVEMGRE
jgi:branched-chain amino acid transport system permease protein